jgi:Ser/Thr protein kinase RdoA (MazF antagonist)
MVPQPASDALLSRILALFPLASPAVVGTIHGLRNDNRLVEDERGCRYVLRRNLQHADVARIEFQLRFQRHLLGRGFPTAEVVVTRSGDLFVLDGDGIPWVLCTYIEGTEFDFARDDQVQEAARRLAQFHAVAETFPDRPVPLEYQPLIREWWKDACDNLRELEGMFAGEPVEEELSYLHEWWRDVLAEWPLGRLDALPVGWVYGDYHGRNMTFAGDEMRGLFDFDDVDRGPMVYDVARGVHMFGREARGSLRIRPEPALLFIEEYARNRSLSDEERLAIPMMVAMNFPPNPSYHRYCRDRRGEDIADRLRREVASMRGLRAEMERIGPLLSA